MSSKNEGLNMGSLEIKRSLNELETVNFLLEKGAKRLEKFQPHLPVLYVFEDMFRGDDGPFHNLTSDKRPSLAIVYDPIELDFNLPLELDDDAERNVYELYNQDGRVELYAINPISHKLILVGTENKTKKYHVRKDRIFKALDGIVPAPESEPKILSFEEFISLDAHSFPRYDNFCLRFEGGHYDYVLEEPWYKRFVSKHPEMESELRRKIQSRDRSKPLKPPEKDLYEAYKLMRGYGASDDDLFA